MISKRANQALLALIGLYIFIWIGLEDRTLVLPIILGALIATAIGLRLWRWQPGKALVIPEVTRYGFVGLISGSLAMPIASLGMLVKVSLHSHVPPDFTSSEVLEVLRHTPVWGLVGLLVGVAFGLWKRSRGGSAV
jgi:hypothetical protein